MSLFFIIFLSSFVASLVSFIGGVLAIFNAEKIKRLNHFIISFAVGALLSVAILDLIPEAAEMGPLNAVLPYVLGGVLLFFVLEKFLFWYHCHEGECPVHTYSYLILWGDFLHNFIDGVILALTFMADVRLGIVTAVAIVLHEIPQEIGDFAVLIHGGFSRLRALFYNFLSALSVVFGAVLAFGLGAFLEPFLPFGLAITAGAFIYLAAVDLMPELHEVSGFRHGILQVAFIVLGAFLVILPEFIFG